MLNKLNEKIICLKAKALAKQNDLVIVMNEDGSFHLESITGAVIAVALGIALMGALIIVFGDETSGLLGSLVTKIESIFTL